MESPIIDDAIEFVKHVFENNFNGHDYFHTIRVYQMAIRIARAENADLFMIQHAHSKADSERQGKVYERLH